MSGIPAGAGQLLGKRLGKFEILALLALGGTAEIYLARIGGAAGFEKYVVVKCLHDHLADDTEFVKMFLDEARLAAHLDHSNIVQTMELGEHDNRYYMVMEFLGGLSLAMIVRRATERLPGGRIPAPMVLNILAQACAGLHYAHEKAMNGKALNIVHRDISPQNLVISFEGVVKLVDFGIAKAELRETRTRSGTIKGKFAYMSPEQCVANNVDRRTDVFALGVIGHELLTGRRLFKRPSPYETYQAVMECDVKPPSTFEAEIDPALDRVIMGAITKDKADRYPSAEAFGDALLSYLHHRGIGSGPGDVARFFDAQFAQEIDEHSARMRELIAGRDVAIDRTSWDDDGEDDRRAQEAGDPGDDVLKSFVFDDLGDGSRGEADDEMPAERTRIESNPLERINELERMLARDRSGPEPELEPAESAALGLSSAVSMSEPPPSASGDMTVASPAPSPPGRFPDAANMPTVIGESGIPVTPPPVSNPLAGLVPGLLSDPLSEQMTELSHRDPAGGLRAPKVPPLSAGVADGTPAVAARPVPPLQAASPPVRTPPGLQLGARPVTTPPGMAHAAPPPRPHPSSAPPMQHAQLAPGQAVALAQGYPVMNAEMSAQIATGATVFPSEQLRGSAPQVGPGPGQAPGPGQGVGTGPMPAPVGVPGGPDADPLRAAGLMSPVGQGYPERMDWGAMAASRVRAVPPWLLAVLFVGAIGIALLLTVVIARLIH